MTAADDRLAPRELVDAYARHAHRRQPVEPARVFTEDGRVTLFDASRTDRRRSSGYGAASGSSRRSEA